MIFSSSTMRFHRCKAIAENDKPPNRIGWAVWADGCGAGSADAGGAASCAVLDQVGLSG
jgi:hypothetical protein